jgi:hypothetical protein
VEATPGLRIKGKADVVHAYVLLALPWHGRKLREIPSRTGVGHPSDGKTRDSDRKEARG